MPTTAEAVEHPTTAERIARGRAARAELPRDAHAAWEPAPGRASPVDILQAQAATRVPELVPVRYGRMLVSAFTFYRGAAGIMAADLGTQPRTTLETQLCGDAHLSNFGAFAAPDRSLVFDVNDFDETLPGPFEWDLKRLVASFAVAGRDRGLSAKERTIVNRQVTASYREALAEYAAMGNLELWYSRIDIAAIMQRIAEEGSAKQRERAAKNMAKAQSKTSMRAFEKLTEVVDGQLRIRNTPPVVVRTHDVFPEADHEQLDETIRQMIRSYRETLTSDRRELLERYEYVDSARKVVGVGSVGTRAWIMLLLGRDSGDPLFLQIKEAEASVLEPYAGASELANHGERVVEGQRLTQAATDIMLGWLRTTGPDGVDRDYYVRQLWDGKGSALVELMNGKALAAYATVCGRALARAHARAGDSVEISSYLGKSDAFDRALATFAEDYADQNERDYAEMQAAVADGAIPAETGV
jgi:uncharacterized protein (DUF2252 family)